MWNITRFPRSEHRGLDRSDNRAAARNSFQLRLEFLENLQRAKSLRKHKRANKNASECVLQDSGCASVHLDSDNNSEVPGQTLCRKNANGAAGAVLPVRRVHGAGQRGNLA